MKTGDLGTATKSHQRYMEIYAEVMKDPASSLGDLPLSGSGKPKQGGPPKQPKTKRKL